MCKERTSSKWQIVKSIYLSELIRKRGQQATDRLLIRNNLHRITRKLNFRYCRQFFKESYRHLKKEIARHRQIVRLCRGSHFIKNAVAVLLFLRFTVSGVLYQETSRSEDVLRLCGMVHYVYAPSLFLPGKKYQLYFFSVFLAKGIKFLHIIYYTVIHLRLQPHQTPVLCINNE